MVGGRSKILKVGIEIGGNIGRSLDQAIRQTRAKLEGLRGSMNDIAGAGKAGFGRVLNSPAWQGAAAGATVLGAGIVTATRAAVEFETSLADVRKVVDGMDDPKRFAQMRSNILELSRTTPISAAGLAAIYAAAGQGGIAGKDLDRFVKAAARMGIAFDTTADQAGDAMAKLRAGMGLSQEQVESLGDAVNHLSNTTASSAPELVDFMQRVGSESKRIAMSGEAIAALGAAMISTGAAPEVAATSFRNMVKALTKGTSATERQSAAYEALGLNSRAVAEAMQKDAQGTMLDVFKRIAKLPAAMRNSITSDLFGDEARALAPLLTNLDKTEAALQSVSKQTLYAGSMQKEYETRSKTTANSLQLLNNNWQALQVTLGTAILPSLNRLVKVAAPVAASMAKFAEKNPQLTTGLVGLSLVFIALVAIAPMVSAALGLISSAGAALAGLKIAATIAGWLPWIIGAGKALLVLATGPVGLVALGVLGIGAAVVWLYNRFGWFKAGVDSYLSGLVKGWTGFGTLLVGVFTGNTAKISAGWAAMCQGLGQTFGAVVGLVRRGLGETFAWVLREALALPGKLFGAFRGLGNTLAGGIQAGWQQLTGMGESPANNIRPIPRARGGPVRPRQPYLVGEKRPEVVEFASSGRVHPSVGAYQQSGGGGGLVVNLTVNAPGGDAAAIAAAVRQELRSLEWELQSAYRSMLND